MSQHVGQSRLVEFRRGQARYVPKARLACGGMAEVWRGEACFADGHVEPVAIKRVLPELVSNSLYRRMLEDEARLGMLLRHPNIVRVFDAREIQGTYILIMELVEGASLREVFARIQQKGAHVPLAAALYIARELTRALEYAHEAIDEWGQELNIVHRDVSPHNVLLGLDGAVKLMDFGLANAESNLADRDPAMLGGKFGYVAPELILQRQATARLDLFAVGVMLWECVTGGRLFQGKDDAETIRKVVRCDAPPASHFNEQVSADLDEVLAGMLAPDPAARYQSARELGADLDYLLEQYPSERGKDETAMLVQLYRDAKQRQRITQTGSTSSQSFSEPAHTGTFPRGTVPGSVSGVPRLPDSLVNVLAEMGAKRTTSVPPPLPAPNRRVR